LESERMSRAGRGAEAAQAWGGPTGVQQRGRE
jgi:hypothetical protein